MFTPPTSPSVRSTPSSRNRSPFLKKLIDKEGREQLTMDVGQKRFGTTICKTCSMVYTLAHPEDEANHSKFHKKYLSYIKFPVWEKCCQLSLLGLKSIHPCGRFWKSVPQEECEFFKCTYLCVIFRLGLSQRE